jgi:hypothetical protein
LLRGANGRPFRDLRHTLGLLAGRRPRAPSKMPGKRYAMHGITVL